MFRCLFYGNSQFPSPSFSKKNDSRTEKKKEKKTKEASGDIRKSSKFTTAQLLFTLRVGYFLFLFTSLKKIVDVIDTIDSSLNERAKVKVNTCARPLPFIIDESFQSFSSAS